jgi:adenylate cyclase class 2
MHFEVEQKFPVTDLVAVERKLVELGAVSAGVLDQVDRYFAHPARDFARTDEALRVRQVSDDNCITYKGPKLDATTKTRREIELPLASGPASAELWQSLLEALGFVPAAIVRKTRRLLRLEWRGAAVEAALDDVAGVGRYVELELSADEDGLERARALVQELAQELGLSGSERRSYLELLLAATGSGAR